MRSPVGKASLCRRRVAPRQVVALRCWNGWGYARLRSIPYPSSKIAAPKSDHRKLEG